MSPDVLYTLILLGSFLAMIFLRFPIAYAVGLVATVMLQSGKEGGGLGALTGSSEGFMAKNKAGTMEAKLATLTKIIAAVFLVLTFALNLF